MHCNSIAYKNQNQDCDIKGCRPFYLETPTVCDFEGNLCGFQQGSENNFNWWIEKPRETQYIQKPRIDSYNSTKGKR